MYIHLFPGRNSYSSTLLHLLDRETDLENHMIIFGISRDISATEDYPTGLRNKILSLKSIRHLSRIYKLLHQADWIYIHMLAYDPTLFFWFINRKLLRKSTWIVWGADVYAFQRKRENLKTRMYEYMRSRIIPGFAEIAAFIKEDYDVVRTQYKCTAEYVPILYPIPVNLNHLSVLQPEQQSEPLVVLIGNSGDPSNNHLGMIEMLSRFSKENINVVCPLGYGGTKEYRDKVISQGFATFGRNFEPLPELYDKQQYAQLLGKVHIALMNHNRQQGLGNIFALLLLGKKVFLQPATTTFSFLSRNNCQVFNINSLVSIQFEDFKAMPAMNQQGAEFVRRILDDKYALNLWINLFNRH